MSLYRLEAKIIGRGTGQSAIACAAYRSGSRLVDERYGDIHDYTPRKGILATGILIPDDAPEWMTDRERLWNQVEKAEKRKDAQLSREFNLALPEGVSQEVRREILDTFLREEITSHGLVADWAIHAPSSSGDQRNTHAHVMTTLRTVSEDGFSANKARELNKPEQLQEWREAWADVQNRAFERHQIRDATGEIRRVDHRSYEDQGLDIEPGLHLGPQATAMERRGHPTDLGDINREIQERNHERQAIKRRSQHLTRADIRVELPQQEMPTPQQPANDNDKPEQSGRPAQGPPANDDHVLTDEERLERVRKAFEETQHLSDKAQERDRGLEL